MGQHHAPSRVVRLSRHVGGSRPINQHHPILCFSCHRKLPSYKFYKTTRTTGSITVGTRDGKSLFPRTAPGLQQSATLRFLNPAPPSLLPCIAHLPTLSDIFKFPSHFALRHSPSACVPTRNDLCLVLATASRYLLGFVHSASSKYSKMLPFSTMSSIELKCP